MTRRGRRPAILEGAAGVQPTRDERGILFHLPLLTAEDVQQLNEQMNGYA
jgi:hypothetical protein